METVNQKGGLFAGVLLGLTLLFLAGSVYYWRESRALRQENDRNEQRGDSLLSVRLQLEGDMRQLARKLEAADEEKTYLDKRLTAVNNQLSLREKVVTSLRQNANQQIRTVQTLNQSVASLSAVRDSLENQMAAVINKVDWLTDSNEVFTSRNQALSQQVVNLTNTLLTKAPRSAITGDAFRVETVKGNKKETAKAKKVNALTVSLTVPAELGLTGTQEVYLSLTDQHHNTAMRPLLETTINLPTANEVVPVHASQRVNFDQSPQRVSFTLAPDETMKPGLYRASVYTKDSYLGTIEFQLRDSFWFF